MKTSSRMVRIAGIAAVGTLGALVPMSAAGAAPYPSGGTPQVNPSNQTTVAPNRATRSSTLPLTGTDVAQLMAVGGASLGVGMVLVRRARRVTPT